MKPSKSITSTSSARRTLVASAMVVLISAATTFAQSSGTSSTTSGSTGTSGSTSGSTGSTSTSSKTGSGSYDTTGSSTTSTTSGTTGTSTSSSSAKLSWGDRRFVTKAADNGESELHAAQLAAQRATHPEVKNFAQKLVDDHSKVNSELMSLASQKNVKIDKDDDKDRAYKRLNKKSGSEFDQEFVEHMIDEHEKDIKMFEKAASDAKDPEVRAFASKHVGDLREHLQAAQSLRYTVMPTGRDDASSGRSTPSSTDSTSSGTTRSSTSGSSSSTGSGTSGTSGSSSTTTPPR